MYLQMNNIRDVHIKDTHKFFPTKIKPNGCNWEESHPGVKRFAVHGIEEKAPLLGIDEGPKALGLLNHLAHVMITACNLSDLHLLVFPLLVTVAEECAEEAGVEVVEHHTQQVLVELKGVGELLHHLGNWG